VVLSDIRVTIRLRAFIVGRFAPAMLVRLHNLPRVCQSQLR